MEHTLAIIKPNAFRDRRELKDEIRNGFAIVKDKTLALTPQQCCDLWAVLDHQGGGTAGGATMDEFLTFMSSGPIEVLVLKAENAVDRWRTLVVSKFEAVYGRGTRNGLHASCDYVQALREMSFFFPKDFQPPNHQLDVREYLETKVLPLINPVLLELCAKKPHDPLSWLTKRLEEVKANANGKEKKRKVQI